MNGDRFDLSRRKALAALGTIGVASAGAGLGTSAYFSDQETFENNQLTAGTLDLGVAYSAHYSDWSPDEGEGVSVRMYDGPAGETGGPGDLEAGETGLPANDAWLVAVDDPEQFLDNTQYESYNDGEGDLTCTEDGGASSQADGAPQPVIDLGDVKPGDFGEVTFDFVLCDNPGYVWLEGSLRNASENGVTEPEADDDDEDQIEGDGNPDLKSDESGEKTVELLDVVKAAVWIDDGDNYQDGEETPFAIGSLREILGMDGSLSGGTALESGMNAEQYGGTGEQGCFEGDTQHSLAFAWWVPVDHGNEIQSDSATFDLQLYTEQCRHNDGEGIGCRLDACTRAFLLDEPTDLPLMDGLQWDGETVAATETVDVGTGIVYEPLGVAPFGFDPVVACVDAGTTVTWEWVDQNEVNPNIPETVHHNVVLFESPGDDCDLTAVDPASFAISPLVGHNPPAAQEPEPFTHTFDEPGIYPYYCEPHGAPPAIADPDPETDENEGLDDYHHPPGRPELDEPQNLLGMRGAVIVTEPRG